MTNRRTTRGRTLAATLAVGLVAVAGCRSASPGATTPGATKIGNVTVKGTATGLSGTPEYGGTLVLGEQQPPPSLDPGSLDMGFVDFTMLAYEPLFYLAGDGSVEPRLAQSWKFADTKSTKLEITLRSGVTFSDGSPVDAEAVKNSLEYAMKAGGPQATYLHGATITTGGRLNLSIQVPKPNPLLPTLLTQAYSIGLIIGPAGLKDPKALDLSHTTDGAGPYIYQPAQSVAGDHYTYTANPGYYDKQKQYYKTVTVRIIGNQQAALNAAKTGQLDVFKGDLSLADQATGAGLQAVGTPSIGYGLALFDRAGQVSKPLGDVRVRQAINFAIDRVAVTKAIVGDYGIPSSQTVVPGSDGYSERDADYYAYNPDKAKQLLTAAGYPNGFDLPIVTGSFIGLDTAAQAIAGQLAKVGIKLDITTDSSFPQFLGDLTSGKFAAATISPTHAPMYLQGILTFMSGKTSMNGFGTTSAELTDLWNRAAGADDQTRAKLDVQIEEYLVENAWFAPVTFAPVLYFANTTTGGVQVSADATFASPTAWYKIKK